MGLMRLPQLPTTTDNGMVYVVQRGTAFKIGFTRHNLRRRVRDAQGQLVLTLPVAQQPSILEYILKVVGGVSRGSVPATKGVIVAAVSFR